MSLLASETQTKVAAVRSALKQVEDHLGPLLNRGPGEVQRALTSVENAELHVGLAFSIASLYFCHLHTQGIDPSSHPIKQELDRIQLYFKKLKGKVEEVREKEEAERQLRIDQDVAKRIVQHYVRAQDAHKQKQRGSDKRSQVTGAEGQQDAAIAEAADTKPVEAEAKTVDPTPDSVEEQNAETVTSLPTTEITPATESVEVEKAQTAITVPATEIAPAVAVDGSAEDAVVTKSDSTAASGPEAVAVADAEEVISVPAPAAPKPVPKAVPAATNEAPPAEPPSSTVAPEAEAPSSNAEKRTAAESAEGEAPKKKAKKKVLVKVKAKAKPKAKAG
eukprot:gnl/MRDRNA2_/MRDRNA2_51860_c0_seq1.p1 gnl/MRDRNA2_/MRDRNA2_51860_c0~~gnl/MRDRNA2_/MRDRNA2_51860_c0_seq1.p1  ORF type:complete len:334 (+),score=110.70 gnl/MRDRNA2_/MRDRNA2_51860_c0_seq1:84-1085(+)